MPKVIAAFNMTLDGFCDHTSIDGNEEMHQLYADLINQAGTLLYGRITYQLMEYWIPIAKQPTGDKATDAFAAAINKAPKIVFSSTLKKLDWDSAKLAVKSLREEVLGLKQNTGKDIYVCSPSLIVELTNLQLIDEYQLCVHPVIVGNGLPLFKNISQKINLKLEKTETLDFGAVILQYQPVKEKLE
ncbi:Dihydrofolate reductase [Indibacter alkaliphilus LW1]|uniref:Dihydrofolate reductase n=1 Tax=Indibacter alkaliphilus (strain CCUG 57479 / KCTC 22604 / LW1) TaxID=1189612 RepID=S2DD88_INDAL|nr:dihydrofolate reductase family protein [Indibacter alkaliphilus]EOZ97127.1 Dihydrofolate reductase [Indibacter alkaliphilus LW1]